MQKDFIKQWLLLNEKAQDSFQKINALHAESLKQISQLQMDMMASCLEGGVEKTKKVTELKSVSELFELQASLYKEWSENMLGSAQSSIQVAMDTKQAMSDLLNEGLVAEAGEKEEQGHRAVGKAQAPVRRVAVKAKPKAVVKPLAAKPVIKKAVVKPLAAKPVIKRAVVKPLAAKPVIKKAVVKPAAVKPVVKKEVVKPVVKKEVVKPVAVKPVVKEEVVRPAVEKPAVNKVPAKPVTKPVTKTVTARKKTGIRQTASKAVPKPELK